MEFDGLHAELTDKILKVFFSFANELGVGFFESVYRRAMCIALREAGLRVREEVPLPVFFRGQDVGIFVADLIVNDIVILELKAAEEVTSMAELQLKHYLRSCPVEVGLVLAFGEKGKFRRVLFTNDRKREFQKGSRSTPTK